jgi:hypothetical protein
MIPVKLIFSNHYELDVFVHDAEQFKDAVLGHANVIESIECIDIPVPDNVTECDVTLYDGSQILCSVPSEDVGEVEAKCPAVMECVESYLRRYVPIKIKETMLDERLLATYAVVKNIPDQSIRFRLFQDYLKRKEAYVISMEAMLDGLFTTKE